MAHDIILANVLNKAARYNRFGPFVRFVDRLSEKACRNLLAILQERWKDRDATPQK